MLKRAWKWFASWMCIIVDFELVQYFINSGYEISTQMGELEKRKKDEARLSKSFKTHNGYDFDTGLVNLKKLLEFNVEDYIDNEVKEIADIYCNLIFQYTNPLINLTIEEDPVVKQKIIITIDTPIDIVIFHDILKDIRQKMTNGHHMDYKVIIKNKRPIYEIEIVSMDTFKDIYSVIMLFNNYIDSYEIENIISVSAKSSLKKEKILSYLDNFIILREDKPYGEEIETRLEKFDKYLIDKDIIQSILEANYRCTCKVYDYINNYRSLETGKLISDGKLTVTVNMKGE